MEQPPDNRERILLAAHQEFLTDGFRASMERVAARAGVAKQTLYNHFPNKQALFTEVVKTKAGFVNVALEGDPENPRDTLIGFARAYRSCVLAAEGLACLRNIVYEGVRFPELCQGMYAEGSAETQRRLAHYLSLSMQAGKLCQGDPLFAAEMLLGMLVGVDRIRLMFGIPHSYDEETRIADMVACFLRAYTPESCS